MRESNIDEKIAMRFSVYELNRVIVVLLNNLLNKKLVQNVQALFGRFKENTFKNDLEKDVRVFLIQRIASTVLEKNIESKEELLNVIDVTGKYYDAINNILSTLYDANCSEPEALQIDKKISQQLKFAIIENKTDEVIEHINNIKSESYDDLEKEINFVEDKVNEINRDFKVYREAVEETKNTAYLNSSSFLGLIDRVIEKEKNPATRVRTGIKLFNEILDGGFQAQRLYLALGVLKGWKSAFLLNSCIWAKRYNKLTPKDPTKKPIILYITLENTVEETFLRMVSHCENNSFDCKAHTMQEISRIFEENKIFTPNDNSAEIVMIYRPNKSITVEDIKIIIEDLAKEGRETMFLAVDYLTRVRPQHPTKEVRFDLGSIADDLHALAVEKDIPVVSACQMNREALSDLETAQNVEQKAAAFKKIGGSNIGESLAIIQNCDVAFSIGRINDIKLAEDGSVDTIDKYLSIKMVANRCKNVSDIESFMHRFADNNDMKLLEDADAKTSTSIINPSSITADRVSNNNIKSRGRH